ncbi:hypothetical protein D3C71_1705390 [compost metagenome]
MAGQAVLLEQREAPVHRVTGSQRGIRQQGREALCDRRQALDAGHLERPLLGADMPGLRVGPHQVERTGARFALRQCRPRLGRVFDRQPRPCAGGAEQGRCRQFGGETVQGHRLHMVAGLYADQ